MKQEIGIDEAVPEMLLVEDIRNKEGAALLPEGTELTEKMIGLLKRKGVANIIVSTMHGPSAASHNAAEIERVKVLFEPHNDEPVMVQLRDILIEHLSGETGNGNDVESKHT